eukprot:CAMPEP_0204355992 /NCGR_PEP_ID=MMETSP0469-20131031/34600_1 /ASSEMBLY_ACC=CAM_ASM_000384 /TAXON_ID=2969 /ORGANISM="Oxyrrhis marina" /LENGTH=257 /DNA_ID=CAMNT_0051343371 /DNA_START=12 /DNA_END=788 /DNA_ORIENTATION=-
MAAVECLSQLMELTKLRLNGFWRNEAGALVVIEDLIVEDEMKIVDLDPLENTLAVMGCLSKSMGRFSADIRTITWSDGEVWTKLGLAAARLELVRPVQHKQGSDTLDEWDIDTLPPVPAPRARRASSHITVQRTPRAIGDSMLPRRLMRISPPSPAAPAVRAPVPRPVALRVQRCESPVSSVASPPVSAPIPPATPAPALRRPGGSSTARPAARVCERRAPIDDLSSWLTDLSADGPAPRYVSEDRGLDQSSILELQ